MQRTQRMLIAATVLTFAVSACGSKGQQQSGPPPLAVDVAVATRADIATYIALDGQIAPLQESTLSTPQSGTVTDVYVNEGQHVSRGQLLAKLDDSTLRAQLAQNVALVAQSQAKLGSSTLQGPITASQATSTVVTAQQQVTTANNSVQTSRAALDSAKLTYNSDKALLGQGYVSETAYQQARSAYVQSQQALNNALESQRQAQSALSSARAQGSGAVPIQNQQIASDRATLEQSQAAVKLLEAQIAQASLVAPFDGVVTQRLLDPGAFASPNQPIVRVSQVDTVYVNVNVPDDDLAYVRKGSTVAFTSSSVPGRTFSGTVFDINATPTTGTLSYRARLRMANPDNTLRGGMLVSVKVRREFHPGAIVVPRTALYTSDQGSSVFTVVSLPAPAAGAPAGAGAPPAKPQAGAAPAGPPPVMGQAKAIPVQVGLQTDTMAEVRSPEVQPGTKIITTRPDALQDKTTVVYADPGAAGGHGTRAARGAAALAP